MIDATIRSWSAWSPGLEDHAAWTRWCAAPSELAVEGRPDALFLPPMQRRRCGPLSRIVLQVAFGCCEPDVLSEVSTVFASRHGNINESIDLLDRLAQGRPLSPTRFSHTVHNAQAGLFSIAAANRQASSSMAAQQDTFACGFLEAMTMLERQPDRPVLLVVSDVPLAPTFAPLIEEPPGVYGLALLLESGQSEPAAPTVSAGETHPVPNRVRFSLESPGSGADHAPIGRWPDAIEFLRWSLSGEPTLVLGGARRRWSWQRADLRQAA